MNKERLVELINVSAPTLEGLSLKGLDKQLKEIDPKVEFEVCTGKEMNDICKLTGYNRYKDNLNIVIITKFSIPMMHWKLYGFRWLDDVVENNLRREGTSIARFF